MVSLGPDTQSYNFTHMTSFVDLNSDKKLETCTTKGSIFDYLYHNPNFSRFCKIVEHASMQGQLNSIQADFTMFIPSNDYLQHLPEEYFDRMDDGLARQILKSCTLNRRIGKNLITSSPVSYFNTISRYPTMKMYVTNISGVTAINNCVQVVKYDILLNNGIIHLVDGLIVPNHDYYMN